MGHSRIFDVMLDLLNTTNQVFTVEVEEIKNQMKKQKEELKDKFALLYTQDKECSINDSLMVRLFFVVVVHVQVST